MKTVKHLLAFLMIILLSVFLCSCSQSAKAHAEKAIKKDLDLLKNLDSETTMQYISYQELFPDSDDSTELSADIKEVFSLFFQRAWTRRGHGHHCEAAGGMVRGHASVDRRRCVSK